MNRGHGFWCEGLKFTTIICFYLGLLLGFVSQAFAKEAHFKINWLAISDPVELERTWKGALVYLPENFKYQSGYLLRQNKLERLVAQSTLQQKHPVILFLHYCEGLGHHREDISRLSRLGFIVIAPNSFAREHRPLGCYEDQSKFIRYFDAAVAFQKAELDYAISKLNQFQWIDKKNYFLFGSGMGGLVVAHYEGDEFAGHLIEGWGCRGPNPIFDGIWAPDNVRVFTTVSPNSLFFKRNPGFSVDCESFVKNRQNSVSVIVDRPGTQVSWYPQSYQHLIKFLMRDMEVDIELFLFDEPIVISKSSIGIKLKEKWSDTAVYQRAKNHCGIYGKNSRIAGEPFNKIYQFKCE